MNATNNKRWNFQIRRSITETIRWCHEKRVHITYGHVKKGGSKRGSVYKRIYRPNESIWSTAIIWWESVEPSPIHLKLRLSSEELSCMTIENTHVHEISSQVFSHSLQDLFLLSYKGLQPQSLGYHFPSSDFLFSSDILTADQNSQIRPTHNTDNTSRFRSNVLRYEIFIWQFEKKNQHKNKPIRKHCYTKFKPKYSYNPSNEETHRNSLIGARFSST